MDINICLEDIIIPYKLRRSAPKEEKILKKKKQYLLNGDYNITVDESNRLIDGYISYLILKELNIENVTATLVKNLNRIIHGIHLNSKTNKEYVWGVPNDLNNITVGDMVWVEANKSLAPVIITGIEEIVGDPPKNIKYVIKKINKKRN